MLERVVVGQKLGIERLLIFGDVCFIFLKKCLQRLFLLLDLPYYGDHRRIVRRNNVGKRHFVYIRGGMADILQCFRTHHIVVYDFRSIGVDIVDAENREKIGNQGHNSQKYDRKYQALLYTELRFHVISNLSFHLAHTPSAIRSSCSCRSCPVGLPDAIFPANKETGSQNFPPIL